MYRQYEEPRALERQLEDARRQLEFEKRKKNADWEMVADLHEKVADLEERVNFAWQDQEFDSLCAMEG